MVGKKSLFCLWSRSPPHLTPPCNRKPALTHEERSAFSALMRRARKGANLSLNAAAADASIILLGWERPDLVYDIDYVRWLERSPATPLSSPHRISAALRATGLTWRQVLEVLGTYQSDQDPL